MGADPRIRMNGLDERIDRLVGEVESLTKRVVELERILLAMTRANAGKDVRRGSAELR